MKRRWVITAWAFMFLLSAAGQSAETPRSGGRLVFGIAKDITSLNPFWRTRSTDAVVRELAFEALLDYDEAGKVVPALAESWTISPDGKTYTFKIRGDVKFHNGKPLTAEDIQWSAQYAMDEKNGATGFTYLGNVQSVKAKDKLTVEFSLKETEPVFLSKLATIYPFAVVPKDSVPSGKQTISGFPAGTGPFAFKEYKAAREIVFTANRNYWQKGLPYLDEIVLKPVDDEQVRFLSLRAGDLDMIERTPYSFVTKIQKGEFPDLKITEAKYAGFRRLIFNVSVPPFNNPKLRQAVRSALDMREFIQGAYWGMGEPALIWGIPKASPWSIEMPESKRDPAKVRALLKEAGVGPDFEVVIVGRIGEEEENQILHRQLTSAGIKTKIDFVEHAVHVKRQQRGEFMITIGGASTLADPAEEYPQRFGCKEAKNPVRIMNYSGYCNEEVDRLMAEAGRITDQKKRHELYSKAIRMIHEEVPDLPLVFVPRFFVQQQKVMGFRTDFGGRFNLNTAGLSRTWLAK